MKMIDLKDREWSAFPLSDEIENGVFSIKSTSSGIDKIKLNGKLGQNPYITRSEINNGINGFIGKQLDYKTDSGNCITVGLDTQTAFYQPFKFYTGQNIQIFRNNHLNAKNANFILPLLKNAMSVFSWGSVGATLSRLKRSKILLPVNNDGNPDWDFMEKYINERNQLQLIKYVEYIKKNFLKVMKMIDLKDKEWETFVVNDLFDVYTGALLKKSDLKKGKTPRITVRESNNGIDGYYNCIENRNYRTLSNFISVSFLGGVFYHPYKASLDMKVHALKLKERSFNKYAAIFLVNVIKNNFTQFSYGNQLSSTDLPRQKIMLPVNTDGNPDWEYMEQYTKSIIAKQIQSYLKFIKASI